MCTLLFNNILKEISDFYEMILVGNNILKEISDFYEMILVGNNILKNEMGFTTTKTLQ
jgi:hypothetical protein